MKIEVNCEWDRMDMIIFSHLKESKFVILVDEDYIESKQDLLDQIADKIYRQYDVVLESERAVRRIAKNFDDVLAECL